MMNTDHLTRLRFALRWAAGHLLASAVVVALAALLVFGAWYPAPWREMLGVAGIFGIVVGVDLVCGPLLTLVLASPKKSRKERWVDLSLVGAVQVIALAYGVWSVYSARPVALVFEVDRLVVVTANEVQTDQLNTAPEGMRSLPRTGMLLAGVRKATSTDEYMASVDQALQGVTQAMRPSWWLPYDAVKADVVQRARPLRSLMDKRAESRPSLEAAASATGLAVDELMYLPLTSSRQTDWIVLTNPAGDVVGHASVDGFE